jgi:GIY-YIG catalytic domain
MEAITKYRNGKIYKITSPQTDKIYIGSTCANLKYRLSAHNTEYKNGTTITAKDILQFDDHKIELIEDYPCNEKYDLHLRERYHIEQNKDVVVNKMIPTKTRQEYRKEYHEKNKQKLNEQSKQYHEANKDKINERQRNTYYEKQDDRLAYATTYREQNKDKMNAAKRERIVCPTCGTEMSKNSLARHNKRKHQ